MGVYVGTGVEVGGTGVLVTVGKTLVADGAILVGTEVAVEAAPPELLVLVGLITKGVRVTVAVSVGDAV